MTKTAVVLMYNWLLERNWLDRCKIIIVLHDEIVLECDEVISEECNIYLEKAMTQAGTYFCKKIPMVSDGGSTKVWDH